MINELRVFLVVLVAAFAFLLGFSTDSEAFAQAKASRAEYYAQQTRTAANAQARDIWTAMASQVQGKKCTNRPVPRPTKLKVLGATPAQAKAWLVENEQACLEAFALQMRLMNNERGQAFARTAVADLRAYADRNAL